MSFRKYRNRINRFISERRLPTDLKRLPGRDQHSEPEQGRSNRRRAEPLFQRERTQPPRLCGPGRDRCRLVEALRGRSRLPFAQARRSLLHRADLREPVRRRGRRRLYPAMVAAPQERRVSLTPPGPVRGNRAGSLLPLKDRPPRRRRSGEILIDLVELVAVQRAMTWLLAIWGIRDPRDR